MPDINIGEKIHEALKRKTFKENKMEYIGLTLIYCLMLYITFVISYFVPFLSIFIFLLVDIPLIMGYKHFIWFGPASGETLIEGFKVSIICGYLNFISYMKIFVTTHIKALVASIIAFFAATFVGVFVVNSVMGDELNAIMENNSNVSDMIEALYSNDAINEALLICELAALGVSVLVFFIFKLMRAVLPYISFLRLTNLEGKSMEGVIAHTKKVIKNSPGKYYLSSFGYNCLYLISIGLTVLTYMLLANNPVYSPTTLVLISGLVCFITMLPAVLFVELNYRNFTIETNQEYVKEQKKMLNDAINDLTKKNK